MRVCWIYSRCRTSRRSRESVWSWSVPCRRTRRPTRSSGSATRLRFSRRQTTPSRSRSASALSSSPKCFRKTLAPTDAWSPSTAFRTAPACTSTSQVLHLTLTLTLTFTLIFFLLSFTITLEQLVPSSRYLFYFISNRGCKSMIFYLRWYSFIFTAWFYVSCFLIIILFYYCMYHLCCLYRICILCYCGRVIDHPGPSALIDLIWLVIYLLHNSNMCVHVCKDMHRHAKIYAKTVKKRQESGTNLCTVTENAVKNNKKWCKFASR